MSEQTIFEKKQLFSITSYSFKRFDQMLILRLQDVQFYIFVFSRILKLNFNLKEQIIL